MVKCNKYVLLRGRRHAPTFARPPISPALTQCQLFSDSESTRIRSRDVLRHEWKPKSNLYHQVLVNVVLPHKNWLSSKEVAAAAALLGSSGCTLQQRRQDSPRAPILRVMKHKRQSGAMRSPALAS